ncbi:hypothetical protein AQJ23_27435 [Streptomyces antibioticus]|nr:hypothetical protein AQJ23_27435 [Streptomyces antibioticus]
MLAGVLRGKDCFARPETRTTAAEVARTVAFPVISTIVHRGPMDDAARIAVETVRAARTAVTEVGFVLFGEQAYEVFAAQAG